VTGPAESSSALSEALTKLRDALDPLGIEVGSEVLDIWRDRQLHGREPFSATVLKRFAEVVEQLLLGLL